MTHALKTWPPFFKLIEVGDKTFEIRKDDRNFKKGDLLLLQEYDNEKKEYTGKELWFVITVKMVANDFDGIRKGYVVLGIKPYEKLD